jgi:hypothetical protein
MLKKLNLFVFLFLNVITVNAQQFGIKNFIGRWQNARTKNHDLVFYTDSTGARLGPDGFLYAKFKYAAKARKDIIDLKLTYEPGRKHPSYLRAYVKFLNDSVFIVRNGWAIPKNADTSNKKVAVYTRIKNETAGTAMRYPNYNDILGVWASKIKDTTKFQKFTFVDTTTLYIQTSTQGLNKFRYTVDFKKQPITVDIFYKDKLMKQCFIAFYNKDEIRLEHFEPNKRPDHFTVFGGNSQLYREKPKAN